MYKNKDIFQHHKQKIFTTPIKNEKYNAYLTCWLPAVNHAFVSYILENSDNCFTAAGLMSRSIICCNTTVSSYRSLLYIVELEVKQSNKLIMRSRILCKDITAKLAL